MERMAERLGLVTRSAPAPEAPEGYAAQVTPPARSEVNGLDQLVTIDAVYRALQVIETGALQLSVDVWRTMAGRTERVEPRPAIVDQPNVDQHGATFYAATCVSLAARGNAYWLKSKGADGSVINLDPIDPLGVHIEHDRRRRRVLYHTPLRREPYTHADIEHLALMRLPGKAEGLGPIQAAQATLAGQLRMREYADGWFDDDRGNVDAILATDQHLTAEQAAAYKEQWTRTQGMKNGPAVLGAGLDYRPLALKPAELQWLDSQKFGVTGIARLLGIPSSLMLAPVEGTSLTYQNVEQEWIGFVRFTLMRYLREIELAISRLLPRTQTARFNVDALLRTDTLTRYQAHKLGREAGFLNVAEIRAMEGLDPNTPMDDPLPATANQGEQSNV